MESHKIHVPNHQPDKSLLIPRKPLENAYNPYYSHGSYSHFYLFGPKKNRNALGSPACARCIAFNASVAASMKDTEPFWQRWWRRHGRDMQFMDYILIRLPYVIIHDSSIKSQ